MATATGQQVQVRDRFYIGGEWVEPYGLGRARGGQLGDRGGHGQRPRGRGGGRRPRRGCGPGGLRVVVADDRRRARGVDGAHRAGAGRPHGGDRRADRPGGRDAGEALAHDPGRAADDELRLDGPGHGRHGVGGGGRQLADRARAGRRGRRDHARGTTRCTRSARRSRPALAAGCTVVLKPSEVAPLNAFLLADVLDELGLPAGVFNLVTGLGPVVGEAMAAHPGIDMISFTGSTARRAARERGRRGHDQEGRARARRQVAERDPRRRPAPGRDHRRRLEVLPQLRPDLQRADAHARPARAPGRGRADRRRGGGALHAGRPLRPGDEARPARLRGPARARALLHPQGRRRRAPSSSPAAPSRPRAWTAASTCGRPSSARSRPT